MNDDSANEALELLKQEDMIYDSFVNDEDGWTVVYDEWYNQDHSNGGRYAYFAQPNQCEKIISHDEWDLRCDEGLPGFVVNRQNGEDILTYRRNNKAPEFEPLIIVQDFHGVEPNSLLLSEEFRLLMNLWQDPESGDFYMISDDDSKELTVRFTAEKVEIRTSILCCYQAARQLALVLVTDSVVYTQFRVPAESLQNLSFIKKTKDSLNRVSLSVVNDKTPGNGSCSRVLIKRILPPPPQEECGIGPFENKQKKYLEFIIGEDKYGHPIEYTCDPDKLANYFGKNPDAPHYLTPVFFKKDVLQRYYDDSKLYSVSDGYLACARKWRVQIDNNNLNVVSVFLGDIGRYIPSGHQQHWLSYNVPPIYSMSESGIRRSFLGQFVESDNPEHQFKHKYSELQKVWEQAWGWRLHREPAKQDAGAIKRLRVPLNEIEAEFKQQLLNLALVLVDLLNEKSIVKQCPEAKNEKGGGISKLECFLKHYSYPHVERDISVLRTVQSMRSRIAAHASGSNGQKYLDEQLNGKTTQEYFVLLLEKVVTMLDSLIAFAVDKAEQSKT